MTLWSLTEHTDTKLIQGRSSDPDITNPVIFMILYTSMYLKTDMWKFNKRKDYAILFNVMAKLQKMSEEITRKHWQLTDNFPLVLITFGTAAMTK